MSRRAWLLLLIAVAVLMGSSLVMVAAYPNYVRDGEELLNATVARELLVGDRRYFLHYQYMPFCGGCTAVSLAGALAFRVAGINFLAWKTIPALFAASILVAAFFLLRRTWGKPAAWSFVLLLIGAPALITQATLMAWGNHFEVTFLILVQAAIVARILEKGDPPGPLWLWWAWGAVAGLGIWFCYSSAFAFPTLLVVACIALGPRLLLRRTPLLIFGFAIGLLPLAIYALLVGENPLPPLGAGLSLPGSETLLAKVWEASLGAYAPDFHFLPRKRLSPTLGTVTWAGLWLSVLLGAAAGLFRWRERRPGATIPAILLGASILAYVLSPFRVDIPYPVRPDTLGPDEVMPVIALRYLVPVMLLLLAATSAGFASLWRKGKLARALAITLLLLGAGPGSWTRVQWAMGAAQGGFQVDPSDIPPLNYRDFPGNCIAHIPDDELTRVNTPDWQSRVSHRRAIGLRLAGKLRRTRVEEVGNFLEEIRSIPEIEPQDIPMILNGLGRELTSNHHYWGIPLDDYLPQACALLEATRGEERHAFAVGLRSGERALYSELGHSVPPSDADMKALEEWPFSVAGCALCPVIGEALALTPPPEEVRAVDDLVREGSVLLKQGPELRAAVLEGAGAAYGRRYGNRDDDVHKMIGGWEKDDRIAFERGFSVGRAERWVVSVEPGTPPEQVP